MARARKRFFGSVVPMSKPGSGRRLKAKARVERCASFVPATGQKSEVSAPKLAMNWPLGCRYLRYRVGPASDPEIDSLTSQHICNGECDAVARTGRGSGERHRQKAPQDTHRPPHRRVARDWSACRFVVGTASRMLLSEVAHAEPHATMFAARPSIPCPQSRRQRSRPSLRWPYRIRAKRGASRRSSSSRRLRAR